MEARGILKAFPKVKRSKAGEAKDAPPPKKRPDEAAAGVIFQGASVFILPAGIGKARRDIFQRQVADNGGGLEDSFRPTVTHVIVEDAMDRERALRLLKLETLPLGVKLVKCTWLSACIAAKSLLDSTGYSLQISESVQALDTDGARSDGVAVGETMTTSEEDSTETASECQGDYTDEDGVSQCDLDALFSGLQPKGQTITLDEPSSSAEPPAVPSKWVCAQSSMAKGSNHNQHITDKLEALAKAYTHQGDKWRALSYSKAVNALKSYHKLVTSYEEACKIPGIGHRMADKIMEVVESGHLRKLDHIGEAVPVLELFTNIWGVGAKTAQLWYQQGFRTLEDIHTKASLSCIQKIGLKHYEDFLARMPREEAADIEKTVREAAHSIHPGLVAMACGSYRRGKSTCGDVDVLISHPDGKSHKGVFSKLLHVLHQHGFLTDDLVSHEENGEQKKYLGVCRLPEPGRRHRRLDIIVVPYSEFACSLMYFTGSAHFNRSMRALAKTRHMSLSEHSLNQDVLRQGSMKVSKGTALPTLSEQDIFTHLGILYREPHERDW
ncbi:DNA polymerase lambda isoform X2 [Denticeps clupeoides]|uniref:DNA polymerase lambda isoform X2 n=1 Tax=Denticeps clupeoides TaxID=299321 RepID=UPI0010A3DF0C|nr:DNA polymerase lambda isoform X2 [Denticeps clupeoides]